jgi:hypothetical protein
VDRTDICVVSRNDMAPDQILMDNKSRINVKLTPDSNSTP